MQDVDVWVTVNYNFLVFLSLQIKDIKFLFEPYFIYSSLYFQQSDQRWIWKSACRTAVSHRLLLHVFLRLSTCSDVQLTKSWGRKTQTTDYRDLNYYRFQHQFHHKERSRADLSAVAGHSYVILVTRFGKIALRADNTTSYPTSMHYFNFI